MNLKSRGMFFKYAIVLALCLGWMVGQSHAQSTYGSITGLITDPSGGAIADVHVTLTNLETGQKLAQDSTSDGLYQFSFLLGGHYRIDAEKTGFKRTSETDVVVQLQQTSAINMTLQLGEVSQTIEVTGETPLLQSDSSSLGQVIDGRKADEIPLNEIGRASCRERV